MTDVLGIWAESRNFNNQSIIGVSKTNSLPWPALRADMRIFRRATENRVLIMGANTFRSLPKHMKTPEALEERPILVASSSARWTERVLSHYEDNLLYYEADRREYADSPETVLAAAKLSWPDKDVAVIGGTRVLEFMEPVFTQLRVTHVAGSYFGDVLAPAVNRPWRIVDFQVHQSFVSHLYTPKD